MSRGPGGDTRRPADSADLVERSVDLKQDLLDFSRQPRFDGAFRRELARHLDDWASPWGPVLDDIRHGVGADLGDALWDDLREVLGEDVLDEGEIANFIDWFILQYRPQVGSTIVEQFVAAHPELPEAERAMLLGWRDVVEGVFEVRRRAGEILIVTNLVDDLTYRVRSNLGSGVFSGTRPGMYLVARLIPVGDEWMLSGASGLLAAAERDEAYFAATEIALAFPAQVFRNPAKLAEGWRLQQEERARFIDFFGSDLVVVAGADLSERMRAFLRSHLDDAVGGDDEEIDDILLSLLDYRLPEELREAETVAAIYDAEQGLGFYPDFGLIAETFANPELADERRRRQVVIDYLMEPSITPVPLRRLAAQDPNRASELFQRVLGLPDFSWERDGEKLLRANKRGYFEQSPLPGVTPLLQPPESVGRPRQGRADRDQPGRQTKRGAKRRRGRT